MKYQNITIEKKYVDIRDVSIDLSSDGIYLIEGTNGSGKTTLLEQLLFKDYNKNIIFDDVEEKKAYNDNRYNLFSYVSQKKMYNEMDVDKYILKMNKFINVDKIEPYLVEFGLQRNILNKKFSDLSGGEQMKISIITALLKQTKYIFMDEPTNYLDNGSVENFLKIIKRESKNRRIIIVSHDPRVVFACSNQYLLQKGKLILKKEDKKEINNQEKKTNISHNSKLNIFSMFLNLNRKYSYLVTFYIILIFFAGIMTYTHLIFNNSIGELDKNYKDSILVYYTGGGHDSLNIAYEDAEHIKIQESQEDMYIDYKEIEELAKISKINNIYIPDEVYTSNVINKIESNQELDENLILYACPEKYMQYKDTFRDKLMITFTEGSLPHDGKNEVAISKNLLISKYKYNENEVNNALGDSIHIDDNEYKIVGFSYLDIAIISYEENENYGFYCYKGDTYQDFSEKQIKYIEERDGDDQVTDLLLDVNEKNEKEVLDYLIKNYPSDCYISDYFQRALVRHQEIEAFLKGFFIHIIISVLLAVIIWFLNDKAIQYNMEMIYDIGNYYINRMKIMRYYIISQHTQFVFLGILCIFINTIFSKYSYLTNWYIVIDSIITLIPISILCKKSYKEVND